ncbi:hypothetical protein E2C01_043777 [Portunus trituberculatus]|uniref:Uncharacterized protein n=1 Tax=Portunus trituberculatus TaxID=210409 RepID=A0A5B7FY86_PORTR|nr:hypothetical protein [Portunus trituberculatus]
MDGSSDLHPILLIGKGPLHRLSVPQRQVGVVRRLLSCGSVWTAGIACWAGKRAGLTEHCHLIHGLPRTSP